MQSSSSSSGISCFTIWPRARSHAVKIHAAGDFPEVRPHFEKLDATKILNAGHLARAAHARFSKPTARFSPCPPRRATSAISPIPRPSPTAIPRGLRTANPSPISPTSPASTRCTSPRRTASAPVKKIGLGNPPAYYYSPDWSPDSKKIAYEDQRLNLWYVDIEKGTPVRVDTTRFDQGPSFGQAVVSGQPLDRLHQAIAEQSPCRLRLFARDRQGRADLRRHERYQFARFRQERQVSLFHR